MLSGLPRSARLGTVLVVLVVGLASLCQVGLLAPQFHIEGGGGFYSYATDSDDVWKVLLNTGLRTWKVTAINGPTGGGEVSAFVQPTETPEVGVPQQLLKFERPLGPARLPMTVPLGGQLVLLGRKARACGDAASSQALPSAKVAVGISTPLGQRWVHPRLFPSSSPGCRT